MTGLLPDLAPDAPGRSMLLAFSGEIASGLRQTTLGKEAQRPPLTYRSLEPPPEKRTWLQEWAPPRPKVSQESRTSIASLTSPTNQPALVVDLVRWLGERKGLEAALEVSFEEAPLESGFENPAEALLKQALERNPARAARWMEHLVLSAADPDHGGDILICLSRLPANLTSAWCFDLVRTTLASEDVRLRYAGVRALENWGGPVATGLLERHAERVPWLADYARRVARDLRRRGL